MSPGTPRLSLIAGLELHAFCEPAPGPLGLILTFMVGKVFGKGLQRQAERHAAAGEGERTGRDGTGRGGGELGNVKDT